MRSPDLQTTEKLASDFVAHLPTVSGAGAYVVGLYGDLGSGKTTFMKGIAKALGVGDNIASPTFVIQKIYEIERAHFTHLIHIDAYRLESASELEKLGWKDILDDHENIIFIEWPERVAEILPENIVKINFTFIDENTREISVI